MAAAQVAHCAVEARNRWPQVNSQTYVIVLESLTDSEDCMINEVDKLAWICELRNDGSPDNNFYGSEPIEDLVWFNEPDLGNDITTIALLNPPKDTLVNHKLYGKGGE